MSAKPSKISLLARRFRAMLLCMGVAALGVVAQAEAVPDGVEQLDAAALLERAACVVTVLGAA